MKVTTALVAGCAMLSLALVTIEANTPPQKKTRDAVTSPFIIIANKHSGEREVIDSIRQLGRVTEQSLYWHRIAIDPGYSQAHRRHAVFQLFHRHILEKSTLSDLACKLHGAAWLEGANVEKMGGLFGSWPFDLGENDSVFRIYCFSRRPPNGIIVLHLSGDVALDDMMRLLHGGKVDKRIGDTVILHVLFSPRLEDLYTMREGW